MQQAITARTGQAFIDGQTSNEAQFKYLMNNAIASKDALNLTVGVTLTSEQVAALTHDIVWLESQEVNGEQVLVPVVYLAQASGRLGPTGALIAGNDVSLIAGKDLDNVGTLKASNNLSAKAAGDLVNSGLIQAGNRLDALVGNTIVNKAGGIIAGRDVAITALAGDVVNERSKVSLDSDAQGLLHRDYADNAARIEAANDLAITAGRDISNTGSVLQSGRDLLLKAGRDVDVTSSQTSNSLYQDANHNSSDLTQTASTVSAGRDLSLQAGRDINLIASQLDAKRDVAMAATENLVISSAADEEHSLSRSKKVKRQEDHVSQVSSTVTAGGDLALNAGQDLAITASNLTAGNEAYLVAGGKLDMLAAQDSDYSLYDMKKKGSFGSKKTKRDEVTDVTNIGSQVKAAGDITLASGGDQTYQGARLETAKDLTLDSGGAITFEAVKDLHQESHEKSSNSLAWNSMSGKGQTDETVRQTQIVAQGALAIKAVDGLHIDVKQVNQQTVSQAIDAMVKADPQLAWLKEAEARGDVDWRQVKEVHDSYKYSNSGLGSAAQLVIAIIVNYFTAGAASGLVAGAAAGTAAAGTTTVAIADVAVAAAASAAASRTAVSVINNKGNLGAVAKDITSKDALKGYVTSAIGAAFAVGVLDKAFGVDAVNADSATHGFDLGNAGQFAKFAGYTASQNVFNATLNTAINGGSLKDNLSQALVDSVADSLTASIYNKLGDKLQFAGVTSKVGAHAIVGGLISELAGGSFKTGALAAGANEAFVTQLGDTIFAGGNHDQLLAMTSQLIGMVVGAAAGGSEKEQSVAGWVTSQATKFNSLDHPTAERLLAELKSCTKANGCTEEQYVATMKRFEKLSLERSAQINACTTQACVDDIRANTVAMDSPVAQAIMSRLRASGYDVVGLLTGNPGKVIQAAGLDELSGRLFASDDQIIFAKYVKEGWLTDGDKARLDSWDRETDWVDRAVGHKMSYEEKAQWFSDATMAVVTDGLARAGTNIGSSVAKPGGTATGSSDSVRSGGYPVAETSDSETQSWLQKLKGWFTDGSTSGGKKGSLSDGGLADSEAGYPAVGTKANGGTAGKVDDLASTKVKWIDENAGMSSRARDYNDSATGARSNPATQSGQAPALERTMPDGSTRLVKFDGVDGDVLVDRKISVVTTSKSKDQALRQSDVLSQNGLTARWEVPTQAQANRAQKMFDELGIKNISVKVIREPGNQ